MTKGSFYRHERCHDTDILILSVLNDTPEALELKVHWVNRAHTFIMGYEDEIVVKKKDLGLWNEVK